MVTVFCLTLRLRSSLGELGMTLNAPSLDVARDDPGAFEGSKSPGDLERDHVSLPNGHDAWTTGGSTGGGGGIQ